MSKKYRLNDYHLDISLSPKSMTFLGQHRTCILCCHSSLLLNLEEVLPIIIWRGRYSNKYMAHNQAIFQHTSNHRDWLYLYELVQQ